LHNAHNMPTARSKALAARAGRSFIDPVKQTLPSERAKAQEEGLVTVWSEDSSSGWRVNGQPRPLVVLDKNGQWRPARSLYEYVQQNVVEICAAKIHHDEHGDPPSYENNYSDGWEDATEVYAKPVGLKTSGGIDTFLSDVMPSIAGFIVNQRRNEESAMRFLRVIARRVNVPDDCVKHIEAFAGLLPARDSVPCRREQLPAFMQRLYEVHKDEICLNNSHFDHVSLKSGHAGSAEVWKGSFGDEYSSDDWTLLPRKLVPQFHEVPTSFGENRGGETWWPEDVVDELAPEAPGHKTFLYGEYSQDGRYYENCYTKTIPWFEERPWDFYLQPVNAWPAGTSIDDAARPHPRDSKSDSDANSSDSDSESESDLSDPYASGSEYRGLDLDSESGQARAQEISRVYRERKWKREKALTRKKERAIKRSRKNAELILHYGYGVRWS